MKKYFICLLFISWFTASHVFAQVNFFQTGAVYGYNSIETIEFPGAGHREWLDKIEVMNDTLINNLNYKILHVHEKEFDFPGSGGAPTIVVYDFSAQFIRFDSLTMKLLMITSSNPVEQVLFDFNLSVGDTVPNTSNAIYVVDSIETISFYGQQVKKFYFTYDTTFSGVPDSQYIIEGMGGFNGLTLLQADYGLSVSSKIITSLTCFQIDNFVYPAGSFCDVFAGIEEPVENQTFIYPNPFVDGFRIRLPGVGDGLLELYDVTGKLICRKKVKSNEVIHQAGFDVIIARLIYGDKIFMQRILRLNE